MTQQLVRIFKGHHRGQIIEGNFILIKPFVESPSGGGHLTIQAPDGCTWAMVQNPRIKLGPDDFELLSDDVSVPIGPMHPAPVHNNIRGPSTQTNSASSINYEREFHNSETDDEAMERIKKTFNRLEEMAGACASGLMRGLIVSGPPGIGKSFGVRHRLEQESMFLKMKNQEPNYEFITGGISSIDFYMKLYANRKAGKVMVLDDCDQILYEEETMSLLKGALNGGDIREICWNKQSRVLKSDDIPNLFQFDGSLIFLSNTDFDAVIAKKSRISSHLNAVVSRCHYLDLEIGSMRDRLLRIRQIIRDGMLKPYELSGEQELAIISYINDNAYFLREVSLRMVGKIADIVKAKPDDWRDWVDDTTLSKESKFKRLYEKKMGKDI